MTEAMQKSPHWGETQESITEWADATFGTRTPLITATRMNVEVAELIDLLAQLDVDPRNEALRAQVGGEIADIEIILRQVAERSNVSIQAEVDRKMAVNRDRKWERLASGRHQHT